MLRTKPKLISDSHSLHSLMCVALSVLLNCGCGGKSSGRSSQQSLLVTGSLILDSGISAQEAEDLTPGDGVPEATFLNGSKVLN